MTPWRLADVAAAVGGSVTDAAGDETVTSATIDSRAVVGGALFAALPGARVDGHDYAAAAVAQGAVAVLAARPVGVPAVVVDDVQAALGGLAQAALRRLPECRVVALTGSSGKTSTKDLLAQVLSRLGPTVAPPGSYNNDLGLPLTVLSADESTRYLVLEMGARGRGHIARLCRIAPPHVSMVLNVGSAHLGEFGSREAIAAAKGEIIEPATDGRPEVAVLNADDPLVRGMAPRTSARVVLAGAAADAEVRVDAVHLDDGGRGHFELMAGGERHPVHLRVVGLHQVANAAAAAAAALSLGLPAAEAAAALSAAEPLSRWRMEVAETPDGVVVVNDAYNANPESTAAALHALGALGRGGRAWAVLGQMAELGNEAPQAHREVGRLAVELGVDRVVAVGEAAAPIAAGAGARGMQVSGVEEALTLLQAETGPGDVVLVKGSRVAGLERVAAGLLEPDGAREVPA